MPSKDIHSKSGFTMIELLMVMMIVAILGAAAVPQFLDFRKEARAATVRQMLAVMRVGIKNQVQQARLRCGIWGDPAVVPVPVGSGRSLEFYRRIGNSLFLNDITANHSSTAHRVCTPSEVTNPVDRHFITPLSDPEIANVTFSCPEIGSEDPPDGTPCVLVATSGVSGALPSNPFVSPNDINVVGVVGWHAGFEFTLGGGACALSDNYRSSNNAVHWIYNYSSGEIFAGSNTPGINECNF